MSRQADLHPALGFPGGPCQVVERIEDEVRHPRLRENLSEKVEQGQKLTNPEAHKIYDAIPEKGMGLVKQIVITPHAQYRMDQRGVTVMDLRLSFKNFTKQFYDWKSQQDLRWRRLEGQMAAHQPVEWIDPKHHRLKIVFAMQRPGVAKIITTFWEGQPDPRPESCSLHPRHAAITVDEMSGVRTLVKDPRPQDKDQNREKEQGLPTPPWTRTGPKKPPAFNGPGESGSDSSGTVHKDKARTKGTPGGQYEDGKTHPLPSYNDTGITPHRRPALTAEEPDDIFEDEFIDDELLREAGMYPPAYPGGNRQKEQKSRAYLYFHKRYRRKRNQIKRQQKRRYRRLKRNNRFLQDRQRRRDNPTRFERRPGGAATVADRGKKYRKENPPNPSDPNKKKDTKTKKKAAILPSPIPFFHYPSGEWGVIVEVSPGGYVHYESDSDWGSVEFETFFDEAVVDDEDLNDLFEYLDGVYEFEADVWDPEDPAEVEDPLFDAWVDGGMVHMAFRVRQRPQTRQRKQRGIDKFKARQRYRRNRMRAKVRAKKRYKRMKKLPGFKKQQRIRRKHPERFKRRLAEVLTAPDIAFVFLQGEMPLGYVRNVSGMTGLVTYYLMESGHELLHSEPVHDFMRRAVFMSEEDIEVMHDLIDAEIGLEAYIEDDGAIDSELVNLFIIQSEFPHEDDGEPTPVDSLLIDPQDDDYFYGGVNKLAGEVLSFFREQRPPDMDPEQQANRGTPPDEARKKRKKDRKPGDPGYSIYDEGVKDSNPGSRVLPSGKGHVEKEAARIRDIREGCGPDLLDRASGIGFRMVRADMRNAVWLFDVQGSKGPYRVRLKALRKGNLRDIKKAHIKVSCTCPFWRWQGPEHWARQGDYLYGKPMGTAAKPSKKDPSGAHRACKHVLAVLNHVTKNNWSVPDPTGRMASLRYLADTLREGEVVVSTSPHSPESRKLAARYLASQEVQ